MLKDKIVESMNGKFLELDVVDLVVPYDDIDVEPCKTISLLLLVQLLVF